MISFTLYLTYVISFVGLLGFMFVPAVLALAATIWATGEVRYKLHMRSTKKVYERAGVLTWLVSALVFVILAIGLGYIAVSITSLGIHWLEGVGLIK